MLPLKTTRIQCLVLITKCYCGGLFIMAFRFDPRQLRFGLLHPRARCSLTSACKSTEPFSPKGSRNGFQFHLRVEVLARLRGHRWLSLIVCRRVSPGVTTWHCSVVALIGRLPACKSGCRCMKTNTFYLTKPLHVQTLELQNISLNLVTGIAYITREKALAPYYTLPQLVVHCTVAQLDGCSAVSRNDLKNRISAGAAAVVVGKDRLNLQCQKSRKK